MLLASSLPLAHARPPLTILFIDRVDNLARSNMADQLCEPHRIAGARKSLRNHVINMASHVPYVPLHPIGE